MGFRTITASYLFIDYNPPDLYLSQLPFTVSGRELKKICSLSYSTKVTPDLQPPVVIESFEDLLERFLLY
jgi:hypothetical protein